MKSSLVAGAVLAALAIPATTYADPTIQNGGFNLPGSPPVLTGGALVDFYPGGAGYFSAIQQPAEGSGGLVLNGAGTATLTVAGMVLNAPYRITYSEAQRTGVLANDIQVKLDGATVVSDYRPSGAPWVDHSFVFNATGTQSALEIDGVYSDGAGTETSLIDNVRVVPVYIWQKPSAGVWTATGSWVGGAMPNGVDQIAIFGQAGASGSVTLDANRTVGSMEFNSAGGPYSIGTSNASGLTLQVSSGSAAITDNGGSHTISVPVTLASDTTITVNNSFDELMLSGPLSAAGMAITQKGNGVVAVTRLVVSDLTMNAGTVQVLPNGNASNVSVFSHITFNGDPRPFPGPRDLSFNPSGQLDLTNNDAIIKSGYSTDQVRNLIEYGYAFGFWGGQGITSTTAGMVANTGLGYMKGSDYLTLHPGASFDGQSVGGNDVLIKYTYAGDADMDGVITMNDYALMEAGFLLHNTAATWVNGDFNYDGVVNYQDYAIIDAAFYGQAGALADGMIVSHANAFGGGYEGAMFGLTGGAVPEPASVGLVAVGAVMLLRRRR